MTGASSGMGREMVYLLADHFAALEEIWVVARRRETTRGACRKGSGSVFGSCRLISRVRRTSAALSVLLKREQPNVKILVNGAGYGKTGAVGTIRRGPLGRHGALKR